MDTSSLTPSYVITVIVTLLISMTVHEFMHGYVAHLLGDTTARDEGRLTLNPIAHIDPFMTVLLPVITLLFFGAPILAAKPVPFNPARVRHDEFGAAMVAAAGPLSNLLLAIISSLFFHSASGFVHDALKVFIELNVALFVFNILPIPPLDGSRVLYAFSPRPLQELLEQAEPYGFFIIIILVLAGGLGGILGGLNNLVLNLLT